MEGVEKLGGAPLRPTEETGGVTRRRAGGVIDRPHDDRAALVLSHRSRLLEHAARALGKEQAARRDRQVPLDSGIEDRQRLAPQRGIGGAFFVGPRSTSRAPESAKLAFGRLANQVGRLVVQQRLGSAEGVAVPPCHLAATVRQVEDHP